MKGINLGEFEELVLLTVGALHEQAYGVSVMDEIKGETGRNVNISAIHTALKRLEEKGFVESQMGGATNVRGGRRKRSFIYAGIMTYKKSGGKWVKVANVSTFKR